MHELIDYISSLLSGAIGSEAQNRFLTTIAAIAASLLLASVVYEILNRLVGRSILRIVHFTSARWDDLIFNHKVLRSVWRFVLAIILSLTLPGAFSLYGSWVGPVMAFCKILIVMSGMMIGVRLISALHDVVLDTERFKSHSLKGIFQMLQLIVIVIGVIIVVSIIIGRDPLFILSGLGAAAAIIMLVFQDTILGLVAGIQLTVNDMLRPGDWISAPRCNANGVVIEVTLTTVKVQNFDMTIITIPPYTLVKDSFQNWRGMFDSKGRRVMRSINIDMNSVHYVTAEELRRFDKEEWLTDAVREQTKDGAVNITLFRRFLEWRIARVPSFCPDMTWLIRELQPTPDGLPVEIYFFTSRTDWAGYEQVQADLLDHVLAAVDMFGLRVFQRPSGLDVRQRQ